LRRVCKVELGCLQEISRQIDPHGVHPFKVSQRLTAPLAPTR
jgi:hypothetical protein